MVQEGGTNACDDLPVLFRHPKTSVYYFRRSIPPELRPFLKKGNEWKESLRTKEVGKAKRQAHSVGLRVEEEFARARAEASGQVPYDFLTPGDAEKLAAQWLNERLEIDEEGRLRKAVDRCSHEEMCGSREPDITQTKSARTIPQQVRPNSAGLK